MGAFHECQRLMMDYVQLNRMCTIVKRRAAMRNPPYVRSEEGRKIAITKSKT